ncbi:MULTISPECIES: hypothetical protein [unclassified Oceanispirochaeta]|uniref:hypothetical protein n=1 Tax=unclassified Oceanispirochaeta TaxID=2635722 RepID=UPI0011C027F8|nr:MULTISPECIES: hypothetical protein [unclassified Oceanispirochaeta]MBF9014323.1 hypothetical protein [Oceanispirochaeta sp. M2]NPD71209.1 hypothetical protein [Oceanispirochaeta sp. M1]
MKVHIPLGPFYLEVFGGGGVNYNFTLRALEGNIEKDLSTAGGQAVLSDGTMDFDKLWGFGYLAGAGFGITFDNISIDLNATFRDIRHDLNFKADYTEFSEVSPGETYDQGESVILLMRGISLGISGSLTF